MSACSTITTAPKCLKCSGSGCFISYSGRNIGQCFACKGTGLVQQVAKAAADIDVTAITNAFEAARANSIKSPKLRLDIFTFSRAPDTGRNAGSIYVKSQGEYMGKVAEGRFHPVMACDDGTKARIVAVASDPHNAAKAYGMKTGSCSCCGRELTNGLSVELGIGPICRDKYGWG